jgi:hypothetical protein
MINIDNKEELTEDNLKEDNVMIIIMVFIKEINKKGLLQNIKIKMKIIII